MANAGERHLPALAPESINHYRHMTAYHFALSLVGGAEVLDYGCGAGYGLNLLYRSGKPAAICGVDCAESAIAYCRDAYPDIAGRFATLPPGATPFAAASLDLVLLFQVIEHVEDDRALLEGLARALRPGGRLVITTPNALTAGGDPDNPENRFHRREYSPARLRALCAGIFPEHRELGIHGSYRVHGSGTRLERWLAYRAVRKLARRLRRPLYLPPVSLADFTVRSSELARSLDLLFVCRRAPA